MSARIPVSRRLRVFAAYVVALAPIVAQADDAVVNYNRDVRPILSDKCFVCHGQDEHAREAGLRLDASESAYAELDSGMRAIVPGAPDQSELVARITESDPSLRMPPEDSHKQLTQEEIDLLTRWIAQGGKYQRHWSFIPPERPEPPQVATAYRVDNPIDAFIAAKLDAAALEQAPEADRRTLIRRLTLDLTGLPPTLDEIEQFLDDDRPDAYDRLVDRLLASPHFGERMALPWLDAARYADTHGYHIDSHREMWPWRDWVIKAFNENLPFDKFTVWQLAGDLLPNPTVEQRIATGFNRNHGINFEGGAIPEEYRVEYVVDRVSTTGSVWLGLTVGCARCHDHKYDPISQEEFFELFAFFNTIDERGLDGQRGNAAPLMKLPTPEQTAQRERQEHLAARAVDELKKYEAPLDAGQAEWEQALAGGTSAAAVQLGPWYALPPIVEETADEVIDRNYLDLSSPVDVDQPVAVDGASLRWSARPAMTDGQSQKFGPERSANYLLRTVTVDRPQRATLIVGCDNALRVWLNGELLLSRDERRPTPEYQHELELDLPAGENQLVVKIVHITWGCEAFFALRSPSGVAPATPIRTLIGKPANDRTDAERAQLQAFYRHDVADDAGYHGLLTSLYAARRRVAEISNEVVTTMVMQEMAEPRETHRLERGQYDSPQNRVTPTTPAALPPLPEGEPPNRLTLARWLVDDDHPLTARVTVNRFWQMLFGTGLVATSGDFGAQGEWPSHPELLDWLAVEFVDSGWDVKHMLRLMVTSAAYRQESRATPEKLAADPQNRLLSHGPRKRLPAEFIRDVALSTSGLLNPAIGGPSVRPYQPPGLWSELAHQKDNSKFTAQVFRQDSGEALYRRGMYTFWKRSVPPPNLTTFDAPNRETCVVRRETTNTPLQALVLLNDPVFVEAARGLAYRMMTEAEPADDARLRYGFELATARPPESRELRILQVELQRQRAEFQADPTAAEKLLSVGELPPDEKLPVVEQAAWTNLAAILLNLDETITKE